MARSIWTGSISFGLVSIPVRVYSAIHAHDVRFHQVTKDGSRIHVQRVSDKTGRKVDYEDLKKGKQYLAAIRPYGKGLAMSTMLFADEVVPQSDIDAIPDRRATLKRREKNMALEILDSLEAEWKPSRYHDDYEEQLRSLIRAKAKGKTVEAPAEPETAKVLDLVEALEASLQSKSRGRTRAKPRRASGARKRGRTRTRSRTTRKRSA